MILPAQNEVNQNQLMWPSMTPMQVAKELDVNPTKGLSTVEAMERLQKYGPNILAGQGEVFSPEIKAHLYRLSMPVALLAAALLSLLFSSNLSAFFVLVALSIVSVFFEIYQIDGVVNEKTLREKARVRRDGQIVEINAENLVPGDIVMMTTGTRVPADGRLYTAALLQIDESCLTSANSVARKEIAVLEKTQPCLDDRTNMAFMSTTVIYGYGAMIVTGTGMNTEIGRARDRLNSTKSNHEEMEKQRQQTPFNLQHRLTTLLS